MLANRMLQAASNAGYLIDGSGAFNGSNSRVIKSFSGAGDSTTTGTLEVIIKFLTDGSRGTMLSVDGTGFDNYIERGILTGNAIGANLVYSSANHFKETSGTVLASGGWTHLLFRMQTGSATAADRYDIYVNGSLAALATDETIAQNSAIVIGSAVTHYIGSFENSLYWLNARIARCAYIDGTALDPTSFMENPGASWSPIDISGLTFGSNGWLLEGQNVASGTDTSGNGNDFSPSNMSTSTDSPTG